MLAATRLTARLHWLWCFTTICVLMTVKPARAQNRGVYPLGMSATNSGVTPEAGFSYSNQLLFYVRDQAKDNAGRTLPATGLNTVVMDMNTLTWVTPLKILGAKYSAAATLPFAKNDLTSDIHGPISGGGGFADSYYLPFNLGWSTTRADVKSRLWFPGADRPVHSGRKQQRGFRILDPRLVVGTNVLSHRGQASEFFCVRDVRIPYHAGGHGCRIRVTRSTWTTR